MSGSMISSTVLPWRQFVKVFPLTTSQFFPITVDLFPFDDADGRISGWCTPPNSFLRSCLGDFALSGVP